MKLLVTSDLHRGFSDDTHEIHADLAVELSQIDWDVLVLAGDLASHKRHQFEGVMKWARELAKDRPVLCVRGNHDYWDNTFTTHDISVMQHEQEGWFTTYKVHHLQHKPLYINDVMFVGWDGWWAGSALDLDRLPKQAHGMPTDLWLKHACGAAFGGAQYAAEMAKIDGHKVVAVTHFPVAPNMDLNYGGYPGRWAAISPYIDILVYGHSHNRFDETIDSVRVVNAGSDYDEPAYMVVEV